MSDDKLGIAGDIAKQAEAIAAQKERLDHLSWSRVEEIAAAMRAGNVSAEELANLAEGLTSVAQTNLNLMARFDKQGTPNDIAAIYGDAEEVPVDRAYWDSPIEAVRQAVARAKAGVEYAPEQALEPVAVEEEQPAYEVTAPQAAAPVQGAEDAAITEPAALFTPEPVEEVLPEWAEGDDAQSLVDAFFNKPLDDDANSPFQIPRGAQTATPLAFRLDPEPTLADVTAEVEVPEAPASTVPAAAEAAQGFSDMPVIEAPSNTVQGAVEKFVGVPAGTIANTNNSSEAQPRVEIEQSSISQNELMSASGAHEEKQPVAVSTNSGSAVPKGTLTNFAEAPCSVAPEGVSENPGAAAAASDAPAPLRPKPFDPAAPVFAHPQGGTPAVITPRASAHVAAAGQPQGKHAKHAKPTKPTDDFAHFGGFRDTHEGSSAVFEASDGTLTSMGTF